MKTETAGVGTLAPALRLPQHGHGFTLIELAIVLFIITLLLGGVLTPLGQQIAERQNGDSRRTLEAARVALVGYALRQPGQAGPLPCPDLRSRISGKIAGNGNLQSTPTQANDGLEDRLADGTCLAQAGNLPWNTLSLAEADAWGNRLGYAVSPDWSHPGRLTSEMSDPLTSNLLSLCSDRRCAAPLTAAALIISHGRNGFGAVNGNGGSNLAPTSADEVENSNGDNRFVMLPPRAADRPDGEYDDLLLPLSPDWLRGRLCDPASLCNGG
jgi:prepilin-type N-terminal cleavage/methylation domain-containing protein